MRFLIPATSAFQIDESRLHAAGGDHLSLGRLEDDGTVVVDVDVADGRKADVTHLITSLTGK